MLNRALLTIERILLWAGITAMLAIMFIVSADAVIRYTMGRAIGWSYDIIALYLMGCSIFLPASYAYYKNEHIYVSALYERISESSARVITRISQCIMLFGVGCVAYVAIEKTIESFANGEVQFGQYQYPIWLSYLPLTIGISLMFIRLLFSVLGISENSRHNPEESLS